jgi:hypothetical protein
MKIQLDIKNKERKDLYDINLYDIELEPSHVIETVGEKFYKSHPLISDSNANIIHKFFYCHNPEDYIEALEFKYNFSDSKTNYLNLTFKFKDIIFNIVYGHTCNYAGISYQLESVNSVNYEILNNHANEGIMTKIKKALNDDSIKFSYINEETFPNT